MTFIISPGTNLRAEIYYSSPPLITWVYSGKKDLKPSRILELLIFYWIVMTEDNIFTKNKMIPNIRLLSKPISGAIAYVIMHRTPPTHN